MRTCRRALAMLVLMTALFLGLLRPAAASKQGTYMVTWRHMGFGVYYCWDRIGNDQCMSVTPIVDLKK